MTSLLLSGLKGAQEPRVYSLPPSAVSFDAGLDALDLAEVAGRVSLPWQQFVVRNGMSQRANGTWAAFEVGVLVSRQNGKNGCIEVVELGWMKDEPGVSILHTAHEFQTALESMDKLESLIRSNPLTEALIANVRRGNGKESIRFTNGSVIRFRTRTKSGGRGFSVDRLVIDEAMIWSPASQAAILPLLTTSARPQIWYLGSAADADTHEHSGKWASLRARGIEGEDSALCWMEWSAPEPPTDPSERSEWRENRQNWSYANPSVGYLLTEEYIAGEMEAFRQNLEKWEIERLSAGRWPDGSAVDPLIDMDLWGAMAESKPAVTGQIALGVDMTADQDWVTITAATWTLDRRVRLEVGYHQAPTPAVVQKILHLIRKWDPCCLVINGSSPAKSLLAELASAGIDPELTSSTQMAEACGAFYTAAVNSELSHANDGRLTDALGGVKKHVMAGGAWVWDYRSNVVLSPLQAATLAHWGLVKFGANLPPKQAPITAGGERGAAVDIGEFDLMTAGF